MSGTAWIAQPSEADVAAVRLVAPLAADLKIRCGPFEVPAAVVASPATLEQEGSEEGQLVRDFIEQNPWGGMGSVHPGDWILLARDDDTVVIGQRERQIALGQVVELELDEGVFQARRMGGWQLQLSDPTYQVEPCFTARTRGTTVTLDWTNGQGLDGTPERMNPQVTVLEGPDEVHFLLSTKSGRPTHAGPTWTAGTARAETTSFELTAPLGSRRLLNNQRIPPVVVMVERH